MHVYCQDSFTFLQTNQHDLNIQKKRKHDNYGYYSVQCGTSNMLKYSVASALTLKRPMSCSGVPLVCPTPGVSGLERERTADQITL